MQAYVHAHYWPCNLLMVQPWDKNTNNTRLDLARWPASEAMIPPSSIVWQLCTSVSPVAINSPLIIGSPVGCSHRLSCSYLNNFNSTPSACRYMCLILKMQYVCALNTEVLKARSMYALSRKYALNINGVHLTTRVVMYILLCLQEFSLFVRAYTHTRTSCVLYMNRLFRFSIAFAPLCTWRQITEVNQGSLTQCRCSISLYNPCVAPFLCCGVDLKQWTLYVMPYASVEFVCSFY